MGTIAIAEPIEYFNRHQPAARVRTQGAGHIDSRVLEESSFHSLIRLEKKRSERSKTPFTILFVDFGRVHEAQKSRMIEKIETVISTSARETDILGWHEHSRKLGVIFTELNKVSSASAIATRITSKLQSALHPGAFSAITITMHTSLDVDHPAERSNLVFPDPASVAARVGA